MDIRRRAVAHTAAATRSGSHWQALLGDLTQAGIRFKNTSLGNFFLGSWKMAEGLVMLLRGKVCDNHTFIARSTAIIDASYAHPFQRLHQHLEILKQQSLSLRQSRLQASPNR
jgi:hypothetical protein